MAVISSAAFVLISAGQAHAVTDTDSGFTSTTGVATTQTVRTSDPVCTAALSAAGETGTCAADVTTTVGSSAVASAALLSKDTNMTAADGTTLASASALGYTIWTRTWSQTQHGLYYVNWWEKHIGRIFFDKHGHVWSTTSTYGYKGYHNCGLGGGIGYSVVVKNCKTERRYDLSGLPISEWDYYQVHVIYKGIPIYASHNMHVNAYPSGAIYGH
ncbi:hypothetical protein BH10ACT10_BH10ACT10_29240 [soil metagenome]